MTTTSKKGLALRIGAIAACAALATTVGIGSFARYHQVIGSAGTDGDGTNESTPRVAEFFFTGNVTKNGTALTSEQLANGVSLFSTAYGADGVGKDAPADGAGADTTVLSSNGDAVVAPGTHGGAGILMEAGDAADGKSHAETNAVVSLKLGVKSGTDGECNVPLIIGVDTDNDNAVDTFYSDKLAAGTYKFNDPTGLGQEAALQNDTLTITGDFDDLADNVKAYYKANGDKFYTDANFTTPTNAGTANEGKFAANIKWYWAYQMSDVGGTDVTFSDTADTALALQAHDGLHGTGTDAEKAAALAAAQIKLTFAADAAQMD